MESKYLTVNPGDLIFYRPILEIVHDVKWPGLVINNEACPIEPFRLLINGKVINAMHQEVWGIEEYGL